MYTSTPTDLPDPPFRFFKGLVPRLFWLCGGLGNNFALKCFEHWNVALGVDEYTVWYNMKIGIVITLVVLKTLVLEHAWVPPTHERTPTPYFYLNFLYGVKVYSNERPCWRELHAKIEILHRYYKAALRR